VTTFVIRVRDTYFGKL